MEIISQRWTKSVMCTYTVVIFSSRLIVLKCFSSSSKTGEWPGAEKATSSCRMSGQMTVLPSSYNTRFAWVTWLSCEDRPQWFAAPRTGTSGCGLSSWPRSTTPNSSYMGSLTSPELGWAAIQGIAVWMSGPPFISQEVFGQGGHGTMPWS